jgi:hypothetical protein
MKIKENTFSTLVLELFFLSIANCKKLKIQKIQKSTSPNVHFCVLLCTVLYCKLGWVDIRTRTKAPLKIVTNLSKVLKMFTKNVLI